MVARPENEPDAKLSATVQRLYDTYPFPPEALLDEPPLGHNWRWHHPSAYAFCTGRTPPNPSPRILDAGCGTGESTSYLLHLNPGASVVGMDLSAGALRVADERLRRSVPHDTERVQLVHKSIFDVAELEGEFDYINCVGVIHHTPDPLRAVRALAGKLKEGGILHIFVYAAHGRWEISLMQKALRLLQGGKTNFEDGVRLGRRVFAALPEGNRLKVREEQRWAQENRKDATFADMYLHPQEVDYDIQSLRALIHESGLQFVGFSNPRTWEVERLLAKDDSLVQLAKGLDEWELYRLVELLDPEAVTHFEFFLMKPPVSKWTWQRDDELRMAKAEMSPCVTGWPGRMLLDRDYFPIMLSEQDFAFLQRITQKGGRTNVGEATTVEGPTAGEIRELARKGVILLTPGG